MVKSIHLNHVKPTYMSTSEIINSEVYLQDITFLKGDFYLIKANSGHGKSSILNFIYGSNSHYNGEIQYKEKPKEFKVAALRKSHISYVFQDHKLFDDLSVFDNLLLKNNLTHYKSTLEIETLLSDIKLLHKKDSFVKDLSLGQKQRVAIIRALCQPFDFLLLDEPFSHLDNDNIKILSEIIKKEVNSQQAGLIITTLNDPYFFDYKQILTL